MDTRFTFSPVASPLHDAAAVQRLLAGLGEALTRAGGAPGTRTRRRSTGRCCTSCSPAAPSGWCSSG